MIPREQAGITKPLLAARGRFARTINANASRPLLTGSDCTLCLALMTIPTVGSVTPPR
jgi:hypothetical protein